MRTIAGSVATGLFALMVLAASACSTTTPVADAVAATEGITVTVSADRCSVSADTAESGSVLFTVVNASEEVAAVEVLSVEELSAQSSVGGIRNIAPGISRDVVLVLGAGDHVVECTLGPASGTLSAALSVSDSGVIVAPPASVEGVSEAYGAWVRETAAQLRTATDHLAAAFVAGTPDAQQLYREARAIWASLRPTVQLFPELLPPIDARESDLVVGERLSGWHAVEKDLWPPSDYQPLDAAERAELSSTLRERLSNLLDRIDGATAMEAGEIAAGAQDLMDAASRALGDNDERWSRAERWLVQGYLDGATAAVDALRPVLVRDSPDLLAEIDRRNAILQEAIDADVPTRELARDIDALATALSEVALENTRESARIEP